MDPFVNIFIDNAISKNNLPVPEIQPYLNPSYSQAYEDIILVSILKSYSKKNQLSLKDFAYIDIGANHPVSTSNTFLLYSLYGMRGLLVEANPFLCHDLKRVRSEDTVINAAVTIDPRENFINLYISNKNELSSLQKDFIEAWSNINQDNTVKIDTFVQVPTADINDLFEQISIPVAILSIDVEGMDAEILSDLDMGQHRPLTIVIEPSDFYIKDNTYQITEIMKRGGYSLVADTEINLIYKDSNI